MGTVVDRPRRNPRRLARALGAGVLALVAVGYVGTAAWGAVRTPRGATVAGVAVGGLDRAAVQQRLERELGSRADRPVSVVAGQATAAFVPSQAGLGIDPAATAERLVGFSLAPSRVWAQLAGAEATEPVTTSDRAALERAVATLADTLDQAGTEGAIAFSPSGASLTAPVEGRVLDRAASARTLAAQWLTGGPVRLPVRLREPQVDAPTLQRAFDDFARPATSGPLTVRVGARRVVVPAARLAPTLSVQADGTGALVPRVDGAALAAVVRAVDPGVERAPLDATVEVVSGRPVTRASRTGLRLDPQALAGAVLPALTSPGRTATVEPVVVQPELTTQQLQALGIVERVSTFTTRFPYNPPRTTNITIAAGVLDGTIVKPGETFSLNGTLGQRTPAKGYQQAPVISGGRLSKDYGGGVSQVSTTLFNAVFFAGLHPVTYKAHSFYISRYPEGREATVSWPSLDQKFRNDSGYGILIKTAVSASDITVSFYGTKVWDIAATKSPRSNVKAPRTIRDTGADCVAQSPNPGFDVTVTRIFRKAGKQVKTEKFFTRYIPEDAVTCG